jgi:DNA-binding HxlR family transcriptional regulator/putative sterol carrier protein
MTDRSYSQFCGVAHALDLVGERWALLVVRELLAGPRRFTDLAKGLPGIRTNILASRLKELERAGVVQRATLPPPAASKVYELTEYGRELEPIVLSLGRWGARTLGPPRPGRSFRPEALALMLRAFFSTEDARGLNAVYELRLGETSLYLCIEDGTFTAATQRTVEPDAVVTTDFQTLAGFARGTLTPEDALAAGRLRLEGDPDLAPRFVELFAFAPRTAPVTVSRPRAAG